MCHIISLGHGQRWQQEMLRIAALGAPVKKEVVAYQKPGIEMADLLNEAEDAGLQLPDTPWHKFRFSFGYRNGFVDRSGRAESRSASRFLKLVRKRFYAGQRNRRQIDTWKRAHAARLSRSRKNETSDA